MFFSFFKGLFLGSLVLVSSYVADNTISKSSTDKIKKEYNDLYNQAYNSLLINMILISPIIYSCVDFFLLDHNKIWYIIQFDKIGIILIIENIGYYLVHRSFHEIKSLYKYHSFHHQFDKILVPSLGNAVSKEEYILAYLIPFVIGAGLTNPNEISFVIPLLIIATLNMMIHCSELNNIKYPFFLVSPENHFEHHQVRTKHYAAPLINIDSIIKSKYKL